MFMFRVRAFARAKNVWCFATALALSVIPFTAAYAGDDCGSTLRSSGDRTTGLVFEASRDGTGVSAKDALRMVRKIAADDKMTSSDGVVNGEHASIQLRRIDPLSGEGMDIDLQLDQGRASFTTRFAPGVPAIDAIVRGPVCGVLNRIKPGAPMAADMPAATLSPSIGTGPMPGPFTPAKTSAYCMANALFSTDAVDGAHAPFRTWTLYDSGDGIQAALSRAKEKVASIGGMRVVGEHYFGQRGALDIAVDVPGKMLAKGTDGFGMRLDIDEGMDTASFSATPHAGQQLSGADTGRLMCSVIAAATRTPMPAPPVTPNAEQKRPLFTNPFKKKDVPTGQDAKGQMFADAWRLLHERAVHAGKAIVIMPMLEMDAKYDAVPITEIQSKYLPQYWGDRASSVIWRARDRPGDEFGAGPHDESSVIGLRGFIEYYAVGRKAFAIFFLDPGTYDLSAATAERRGVAPPQASGKHAARGGVGTFSATKTVERGFFTTREWQPETHETMSRDASGCVTEDAASGRCVQTQSYREQYEVKTSEAGYVTVVHEAPLDSTNVRMDLSKPMASFEVGRGEVVIVDGFMLDAASARVDNGTCEASGDITHCSLSEFSLWRIPAKADDLLPVVARIPPTSILRGLISSARLRPVTINATALPEETDPGMWETGWARRYVMKAH